MESVSVESLQQKLGLSFGEARKVVNKIERFKFAKPKATTKIGFLEENGSISLVLILNFDKYKKESINNSNAKL